jgi:hypothetical protein
MYQRAATPLDIATPAPACTMPAGAHPCLPPRITASAALYDYHWHCNNKEMFDFNIITYFLTKSPMRGLTNLGVSPHYKFTPGAARGPKLEVAHEMIHNREKLLQIGEVARRLGVAASTVRRLDDELQPIRPNPNRGHRRYRLDLIERHLKRST